MKCLVKPHTSFPTNHSRNFPDVHSYPGMPELNKLYSINMTVEESIDEIINQDQTEIKTYWSLAIILFAVFLGLSCWNVIISEKKELISNAINILSLAASYIPVQQIIKRRRRVKYLDKIIRVGLSKDAPNRAEYERMILELIKAACTT